MIGMLPQPRLENRLLEGLPALTDEALFEVCGVRIAFTSRDGGVSKGAYSSLNCGINTSDNPSHTQENRQIVYKALGAADASWIVPNQVHGAHVATVRKAHDVENVQAEVAQGADAILVECAGVGALVNSADCLPFIIVAPDGRFAVAHAGWRGTMAGVAGNAVRALSRQLDGAEDAAGESFDSSASCDAFDAYNPAQFNAYIGPHICPECFEVGPDMAERFAEKFGEVTVPSYRHVDLARAVICDLVASGMSEERIARAGLCTQCNPERFFSYRATDGACGRQCSAAVRLAL